MSAHPAPAHPGWLIIDPDQAPCAWYRHDQTLCCDEVSTLARFEPNTALRARLVGDGWTVRVGAADRIIAAHTAAIAATA